MPTNNTSIYNILDWSNTEQSVVYGINDIVKYNNFYYYSKVRQAHGLIFDSTKWMGVINFNGINRQFFEWVPSYNSKITIKPSTKRVQFGDGYSSVAPDGINTTLLPFDLIFEKRSDAEARALIHFFELHQGSRRFVFTPPPPYNINKLFIATTYDHTLVFMDNNNISVKFEEMVI